MPYLSGYFNAMHDIPAELLKLMGPLLSSTHSFQDGPEQGQPKE